MTYTGKDFLLGPDGDLAIENGDVVVITGSDVIRQMWFIRVRTFLTEWVIDETKGVPYIQQIFSKTATPERVNQIFREVTLDTPGILTVESVAVEVTDAANRTISVTVEATIEGDDNLVFRYEGDLPLGSVAAGISPEFPLSLGDLRIWLDSQDLGNLTYNSPLKLNNKAGTGEANGECTLEGVSDVGNKRSALFDESAGDHLNIADTKAIRHGDGSISIVAVLKRKDASDTVQRDRGILALNGYDTVSGKKEFYNVALRGTDTTPDSTKLVIKSERVGDGLLFEAIDGTNGVGELSDDLTINSITQSPTFIYHGGDATTATWTAATGNNLSIAGGGSLPTPNTGSPCFGADDDTVKFNDGQYYEEAGTTFGDIGLEDFVLEFIVEAPQAISSRVFGKFGSLAPGWNVEIDSFGQGAITLRDNVVSDALVEFPNEVNGDFHHIMLFVDRSGSAVVYQNGDQGTPVDVSVLGTFSNSFPLRIGGLPLFGNSSARVARASLWKRSSWLDTHLQADVAKQRFAQLVGTYPSTAGGTATPTMARASRAYLDKYEGAVRCLYGVGDNWARLVKRKDGAAADYIGILPEAASTNLVFWSENLTAASWSKPAATVDFLNGATSPDKTSKMHGIIANGVFTAHWVEQQASTVAGRFYFSCFAQKGDKDWMKIDADGQAFGFVNLSDGSIGTLGTNATIKTEDFGNGIYRIILGFDDATPTTRDLRIIPAASDGSSNFAGDSVTVNTWVWGVQFEAYTTDNAPLTASTYIKTEASTETREGDEIYYTANDGNFTALTPSASCDVLAFDTIKSGERCLLSFNASGSTTGALDVCRNVSDEIEGTLDAGSASTTGTISDGTESSVVAAASQGGFVVGLDGETVAGSGGPLATVNRLTVGASATGGKNAGMLIKNLKGH
jgi:hypothetical protein